MNKSIEIRPRVRPFGGRRGPMYFGDLRKAVERAAYKAGWHYRYRDSASKASEGLIDPFWVAVIIGSPEKSTSLNSWETKAVDRYSGVVGNTKHGMIPEYDVFEQHPIDGPVLQYRGWRNTLIYWISRRWIRPSKEIQELLGPRQFRSCRPRRAA